MIKTVQTIHIRTLKADYSMVDEVLTGLHRYHLMCGANAEENENTELCHPRVVRVAKDRKHKFGLC
jgi:hypothetical protein